jgi:hypothetical protein
MLFEVTEAAEVFAAEPGVRLHLDCDDLAVVEEIPRIRYLFS